LRWAKAEIAETQTHLRTGQARGYFTGEQLSDVWRMSKRIMKATTRLLQAKLAQIDEQQRAKRASKKKHP
jgi:hypothetical protein